MVIEKKIIYSHEDKVFEKKISILKNEKKIHILSNPIAWKILKLISDKPKYAAQNSKGIKNL